MGLAVASSFQSPKRIAGEGRVDVWIDVLALPIARRELLVLSRASATWRQRLGTSATVLIFGILLAMLYHYAGQMAMTQVMHFLGVGLSIMCLFTGLSLTADAIAEEKRGGTLGLLFLTNLSPFEILLGKLVAHGTVGLYSVLCALPLLSMSMIFGGMRLADVLMYVGSAINVLFFSAALGLWASSVCNEKRAASGLATLMAMILWIGLPLLTLLLSATGAPQWLADTLAHLCLNFPTFQGIGFGRWLPSTATWWDLAWPQILGWTLIGLTVWRLPRCWQEASRRKRWALRDLWKTISYGKAASRLELRRKLLDRNPFMWLASRDRLQAAVAWIIALSVMAAIGYYFFRVSFELGLLIGMGIAISALLQLTFSQSASTQLVREYEQGTLELLLSTPLSVQQVIRGQLAATRRHYRNLFVITVLILWAGIGLLMMQPGRPRTPGIISLTVYSMFLGLNFYAMGWVGMWTVVKAPDPRKAHGNAFFILTIFPGLLFALIVVSVQFLYWLLSTQFPFLLAGLRFSPGPKLVLPLLFLLAFGNCFYWLRLSKRELPGELRLFAFRRYTPSERLTFLGRLGRFVGIALRRIRVADKLSALR